MNALGQHTGRDLGPMALQSPRRDFIARSHQRSTALGLTRAEPCDHGPLPGGDLALARERTQRLCLHAAPVMQLLFQQIVNTESMIVLTDAQGTVLHSVGDDDFLARADKVALAPGANWAEHAKGTNAIGTALFEEVPTLVHGHEHFMHANSFLTCSAAPIFDPRGNMLGVLDVTGDHRGYHQHTMGLVRMSASMIENHWLSDDCNQRLRIHFHGRAEFIGTLLEGILAVGPDGRILGANRSALEQLGLSGAALRAQGLASLFGTTPAAVYDHFRTPMPAPLRLSAPCGREFHATARFDWPSRPMAVGLGVGLDAREAVDIPMPCAPEPARPAAPPRRADAAPRGTSGFAGLQSLRTGDPKLDAVIGKIRQVLDRDIPLLILGETGTGKELLARAVHHDSARAGGPFVAVDCASLPEALIEAELFGHEDGAFTGARRKGAVGRLAQAHRGTLFLDEIGDMPLPLQARLLRVLQERCVTPLGAAKAVPVDIAVICATHRNLREMIAAHAFREDLYYRINGLAVRLPALRDRSDLDAVARRILHAERPLGAPELSTEVQALLHRCVWPGNIRQLANVLRTAAALAAGERQVTLAHLPDDFLEEVQAATPPPLADVPAPLEVPVPVQPPPQTLETAEIALIRAALAAAGGNISAASRQLGISRNTIYRKLNRDAEGLAG